MSRPKLLDLFCGSGGCSEGYSRAGFDVFGVDSNPKPLRHYPFPHVCADALEYCREHGHEFDVIHASPPCQAYSTMKSLKHAQQHQDLIPSTRAALMETGKPYVIENVPGAPLVNPIVLCGSMFGLKSNRGYLRRHRFFESSVMLFSPECKHNGLAIGIYGHGSAGYLGQRMRTANVDEARILLGIDWMTRDELSQAIPPAYCEFIGRQLIEYIS